jgi:hypothetical protein
MTPGASTGASDGEREAVRIRSRFGDVQKVLVREMTEEGVNGAPGCSLRLHRDFVRVPGGDHSRGFPHCPSGIGGSALGVLAQEEYRRTRSRLKVEIGAIEEPCQDLV